MSEHLFVGGLADGRWLETQERERVRAGPVPRVSTKPLSAGRVPEELKTYQEQSYQAIEFRGTMPDVRWLVYAPLDWTPDNVFTKLLREYNP